MNRPSRRTAKVFEEKDVPLADIVGFVCAWDGCTARFGGAMPRDWTNLLAYWSQHPESNFLQIPAENISRDRVLCPDHARVLESQLKDFR
jgi:hypothetical protein